jgi:flagellar motility protein MotE (MotC chaperone)
MKVNSAADLLYDLTPKKTAEILAKMEPKKAAAITEKLAEGLDNEGK